MFNNIKMYFRLMTYLSLHLVINVHESLMSIYLSISLGMETSIRRQHYCQMISLIVEKLMLFIQLIENEHN